MSRLRDNLLVQFSVLSLVIMVMLAISISNVLTTRLDRNVDLLKDHGAAMMSGVMIQPSDAYSIQSLSNDVGTLRWITYGAVGFGFLALYGGLVTIVWRGWRTINRQQAALTEANGHMEIANAELKQSNQELRDAQDRLVRSERLAAIGELAAGMAHELRNPLGGINTSLFYIKGKLKGSGLLEKFPRIDPLLSNIETDIERSNSIITDLMDYARVRPSNPSPASLEGLIEDALSRIKLKETVNVIREIEPGLPDVLVEIDPATRAFINLLKNADDAMPDGGTLILRARAVDGMAYMEISDTGNGIAEDELSKVFEPLFTTKLKGIGLGLPIVRETIQRHGGSIEVSSELEKGTTFTIRLPLSTQANVEAIIAVGDV